MSASPPAHIQGSHPTVTSCLRGGVALAALLGLGFFLLQNPLDDAFIVFRYARNLIEGHGLVFNVGEPVEGYTSLGWALWVAVGLGLGVDPVVWVQLSGVAAGLGTLGVVAGITRRLGGSAAAAAAAALALAVLAGWGATATNGLESTWFSLLVGWAAWLAIGRRPGAAPLAACGALLVLTRPEGVAVAGLLGLAALMKRRGDGGPQAPVLAAGAAVLAVLSASVAFRVITYGEWLPNTFYAKASPLAWKLTHGGQYLAQACAETWLAAGLLAAAWCARRAGGHRSAARLLTVASGIWLAIVWWEGGDYFAGQRFLQPAFVLLAPLLGFALMELGRAARPLAIGLALVAVVPAGAGWPAVVPGVEIQSNLVEIWRAMGRGLKAHLPPDASIAMSAVGAVPWESRLRTVDVLGLTDRHIARVAPDPEIGILAHRKHDGAYVLDQAPTALVVSNGLVAREPMTQRPMGRDLPYEADIFSDPRFARDYRWAAVPLEEGYVLSLYVRADLRL